MEVLVNENQARVERDPLIEKHINPYICDIATRSKLLSLSVKGSVRGIYSS